MLQDHPNDLPDDYVVVLNIRSDDYVFYLFINYYARNIYKPLCISNVFWEQTIMKYI
jgi:hypothetical protein